ncbi:MAG: hypothetical protein A3K19_12215 [Lentisphaerae bacterium RIFOXYB12_FULL_65_16]|nr:MAG: hypothetical protein A3K18_28100 [Lentisphaerae bacterium RIFOXYA12_64_32]OGV86171.1 MAG: hypothetical protein A3K19_12215 [Lentisphaerae bacterium RIFOXYB12_FULL_65_16]
MGRLVTLIGIAAVLATGRCCPAATLDWVMTPTAERNTLTVTLYAHNPGPEPAVLELPDTLACRLSATGGGEWIGNLTATVPIPPGTTLPAEGFRKVAYQGPVPADATGIVRVTLPELPAPPVLVELPPGTSMTTAAAPPGPADIKLHEPDTAQSLEPESTSKRRHGPAEHFAHFTPYEPVYIVAGQGQTPEAKFQISFKYQLFGNQTPWLMRHLYLGYTQTSIWDVGEESAPFHDTSYKPGLFLHDGGKDRDSFLYRLGWETGLQHESNGEAESNSRSINTVYIKPILKLGDPEKYSLTVAPRVYEYIEKSDNKDIADYRGYADLTLRLEQSEGWMLSTTLRKGMEARKDSVQIDFAYPLDRLFATAPHLYLHLQYFAGYGESILEYDERVSSQIRLGIMLFY